jgi:hypothetical protein
MATLWDRLRIHPLGVYVQVWAALALMVFGVFSYLSIKGIKLKLPPIPLNQSLHPLR